MPLFGIAQGSLDALEGEQRRSLQGAQMLAMQQQAQQRQMQLTQMARALQARGPAGQALFNWAAEAPQGGMPGPQAMPTPMVPPPPNVAPAPGPGTLSPGGGNPQAGPPATPPPAAAQPAAPAGPPMPLPAFRPMPTAAPGGAPSAVQAPQGMVPPPPAPAPDSPPPPPPHIDIRNIIKKMREAGVPPDQVAEQLEMLQPIIKAQQQDEINYFRAQTAAQNAAIRAMQAEWNAYKIGKHADIEDRAEGRKQQQGDRRGDQRDEDLAIKRDKEARIKAGKAAVGAKAGGTGNIKKWEFDPADPTKVVGGWTATGKHVKLDEPGQAVPGKPGGGAGAQAAVRSNLVQAGAKNALARLDEIEKDYPNETASFIFGQEAKGMTDAAIQSGVRGAQSERQQAVDARWGSFIDEAIPVFTGGLRGSDAFRRFLIAQAPTSGTKTSANAEKRRLFRENINGTQSTFANAFRTNPSYWAAGVTKEQVEQKLGGGTPRETAPQGVPQGSKKIGKTPEGKDVWEASDGKRYTAD